MSFDAETLSRLLPAIHALRDAELAAGLAGLLTPVEATELKALADLPSPTLSEQGRIAALSEQAARGPLKALLETFAAELGVLEENLAQLYDDLFIETCADWVIPYIGDLVGYEPLHSLGRARGLARAEVAHTIALRRRKGTAAALEQIARDVTGWNARAVEYFEHLATTQHMNHLRPHNLYAPDLRRWEPLARIGSAFESVAHTVDVRRIESRRGRFNIPNVGIFLWRLGAYRHTASPAVALDDSPGNRRFLISPLGHSLQLYTNPVAEEEITHLAEPINVPDPIKLLALDAHKDRYYGTRESPTEPVDNPDPSLVLYVNDTEVPRGDVVACNLSDDGAAWAHDPPAGKYGIDPVLGRIAVGPDLALPESLRVTYHYGFSADLGGGEYDREYPDEAQDMPVIRVPDDHRTIQAALDALGGNGVVEITDSGSYKETLSINVNAMGLVSLRAAAKRGGYCRPTLELGADLVVTGETGSTFTLDGLLVAGGHRVRVPDTASNQLARIHLLHTTLVPGLALDVNFGPYSPTAPSLLIELAGVIVALEFSIVGPLRVAAGASLSAKDSIIDASDSTRFAYCAPDDAAAGGELSLVACTLIGKVNTTAIGLISNSLLLAASRGYAPLPPVHAQRRQSGCVRFSYLPLDSLVPRRYRCQPAEGAVKVAPRFTTLRYGLAAYCQLSRATPDEIRRGADDEGEMGAFHALYAPQREANLEIRLREYLRVGLEAGITYQS